MFKKIIFIISVLLLILISSCNKTNNSYEKIRTVKLGDNFVSTVYYLENGKSEEDIKSDAELFIKEIDRKDLKSVSIIILFDKKWAKKIATKKTMIDLANVANLSNFLFKNSSSDIQGGYILTLLKDDNGDIKHDWIYVEKHIK